MRALSDVTSIPQEQAESPSTAAADAASATTRDVASAAAWDAASAAVDGATEFAAAHGARDDRRDVRRAVRWVVNLIAPGSGLILAGRSRLGVSMALTFTLAGVTACWGWWIVPLSIPPILRWLSLATALLTWVGAQVSLRRVHAANPEY